MTRNAIARAAWDEKGQSLVEYALILFFVAVVVVAGLTAFGNQLVNMYDTIVARIF